MIINNRELKDILKYLGSKASDGREIVGRYSFEVKEGFLIGKMIDSFYYKEIKAPIKGDKEWEIFLNTLPNHKFKANGITQITLGSGQVIFKDLAEGTEVGYPLETKATLMRGVKERGMFNLGGTSIDYIDPQESEYKLFRVDPKKLAEVLKGADDEVVFYQESDFTPIIIKGYRFHAALMPMRGSDD